MKKYSLALNDDTPMWDIWMSMYQISTVTVADEIGLFKLLTHGPLSIYDCFKFECKSKWNETLIEVLIELKFLGKKKN